MKRPISILCMADLHYEKDNVNGIDRLSSNFKEFVSKNIDNQRWNPDYIVIAGDVIDWTSQYNPDKYDYAKQSIEDLRANFGIEERHVIIIPGNHDNMISTDVKIKDLDQDRIVFEKYCNDEKGAVLQAFKNTFLSRFEDYLEFCKQYMKGTEYFNPSILSKELQCLAGVRVCKEDHLCFVIVNTEWLYIPKDPFEKHIDPFVSEGISTHMKLYEKCQLCAPLIKDAYQLIRAKYADYTIVTVMHRGFEDLTWKENNASDKLNIDAIKYLKSMSDIILTGHDHTIQMEPPTLINNRIQHFRLGSVGRKEPKTREYIRTASIIRFSPIDGEMELLNMEFDSNNKEWSFMPHAKTYPLFSKYEQVEIKEENKNETFIRARSEMISEVESAIRHYYKVLPTSLTNPLITINASDVDNYGLEKVYVSDGNPQYIVIYYIYNKVYFKGREIKDIVTRVKGEIASFKERHLIEVLTNRIIIGEVFVETPIIDILEKNGSKSCSY